MKYIILFALVSISTYADITQCNGSNGYKYSHFSYTEATQPGYGHMMSSSILTLNDRVVSDVREYYAKRPSTFGTPAQFIVTSKRQTPGARPGFESYTIQAKIPLEVGISSIMTFSCFRKLEGTSK